MRCAMNSSARSEASSALCASSTAISSGRRSAMFATTQWRPCRSGNSGAPPSRPSTTSPDSSGAACAAAPASTRLRSRGEADDRYGSNSCSATPNGNWRSSSPPRARSTVIPLACARWIAWREQQRLADPAGALQQDHAALARLRGGDRLVQRRQLRAPRSSGLRRAACRSGRAASRRAPDSRIPCRIGPPQSSRRQPTVRASVRGSIAQTCDSALPR